MTARTLILIAAAFLSEAIPTVRSEETAAAPKAARYQEALKSIDAEVANSIVIFRDEVNAGKEEDGWRADVKETALQWLKVDPRITPPAPAPSNDEASRRAAAVFDNLRRRDYSSQAKLPPPASALAAWLGSRIEILQEQRSAALAGYAGELADFAEDIWLKAEKPADLRPVAAAFAAFDALAPNYLAQTNLPSRMRPPVPGMPPSIARLFAALQDPRRVEAFYAALFTAGDAPLVFPNPKTDAEGYTKARVIWSVLLRNKTPFQIRLRVKARVAELDAQYDALRVSAGERLNALIQENASAAVFEVALNHFNAFQDQFDPRLWGMPPQIGLGMPLGIQPMPMAITDSEGRSFLQWVTQPSQIHDYHDLLGPRVGGPPRQMMGGLPWKVQEQQIQNALANNSNIGVHKTYRQWLDYRRAEESGAAPTEMATLWEEFRRQMNYLPLETQSAIRKRHESPDAPEAAASPETAAAPGLHPASPETQPVAELIAALEALATRIQYEVAAGDLMGRDLKNRVTALLNEWKGIDSEDAEVSQITHPQYEDPMAWQALAVRPDCLTLFALREKAVRYALARIVSQRGGGAEEALPIRKALETALEKSVIEGDWPRFRRVLRLDSAANLLPGAGHIAWSQMANAFEQAAGESKSSPEAAKDRYFEILRTSDNAAIAALAIRCLKALPGKGTPP
jgi:hypothetical protein